MNAFLRMAIQVSITLLAGCSSLTAPTTPPPKGFSPLVATGQPEATSAAEHPSDTPLPLPTPGSYVTFAPQVKVRQYPNFSSTVLSYLPEGRQITATCYPENVELNGLTYAIAGWCHVGTDFFNKAMGTPEAGPTGWIWGGCLGLSSECK
jgi:hypothetical protein